MQRYLIPALGDEIFTDQQKKDLEITGTGFCTAEEYLQQVKDIAANQEPRKVYRAPFVFSPKKAEPTAQLKERRPAQREKPKSKRQLAREEKAELLAKWKAEDEAKEIEALRNKPIWSYYKVVAIAAAAYIKGLEAVMGIIPEELWDEKTQEAIKEARANIIKYNEYETIKK